MRYSVHFTRLLLFSAAVFLQGCALQQWQINNITQQLVQGRPELALGAMQSLEAPDRDQAQYLLNLGMLKHLTGDIEGSIIDLQKAASTMERLQAISIREGLGAATVNETLRAYAGSPAEQVLAQQLLTLNYLMLGDLDGARVEVLKTDLLMREPVYDNKINGQLASARMIAGLVFELGAEWDNALISYRKAAALINKRKHSLPAALEDSLLRMTKRVGISDEYQQYVAKFGRKASFPNKNEAEVIAIYWQGLVSQKQQAKISIYAPGLNHFVSIAVPKYKGSSPPVRNTLLTVGQQQITTELVEDINQLAREDLDAQMPKIVATTLVRVVAKHEVVEQARRQDEKNNSGAAMIGIIADIATNLSEIADVRSWNTLPATIQIARLTVPIGSHPITLGRSKINPNPGGPLTDSQNRPNSQSENLAKGQKIVILGNSLATQLYHYKTR
jgi:hypothetical protein